MLHSNKSRELDDFWENVSDIAEMPKKKNILKEKRHYFLLGMFVFMFLLADLLIWNTYRSVKLPFREIVRKSEEMFPEQPLPTQEELLLAMKEKDTDGDTLTDYDELYVYGTSAYIDDTDSDGVSDSAEIQKGEDPLCSVEDEDCGIPAAPEDPGPYEPPLEQPKLALPKTDPAEIRVILEKSGIPKNQIDVFTDEELMTLYQQAVLNASSALNGQEGGGEKAASLSFPTSPTPAEIRDILIKSGIDAEKLKGVSDEEIMKIYLESLETRENGATLDDVKDDVDEDAEDKETQPSEVDDESEE